MPFTVSPHLSEFHLPLADFIASRPKKYTHFGTGCYIFSTGKPAEFYNVLNGASTIAKPQAQAQAQPRLSTSAAAAAAAEEEEEEEEEEEGEEEQLHHPRLLLLQRSLSDSYGGFWENPGGMCEHSDATLLDGAAREVFEETGLQVTRFRDLVAVDEWVDMKKKNNDGVRVIAKFSFLVDVDGGGEGGGRKEWEYRVRCDPDEHQHVYWATEEEVRRAVEEGKFVKEQGRHALEAFEAWRKGRSGSGSFS